MPPDVPLRARRAVERFPFTERRLAGLERPTVGSRYVYDTVEAGLCVRLTPTRCVYAFYRWHNCKPDRITIAMVGTIQLRQARAIAAGLRGDLARGIDVFARARQAKAAPGPATLDHAFKAHVARSDMRPATRREYVSLWRLVPARMKSRPLASITQHELKVLHDTIGARYQRTADKLLALLSVLFRRNGRLHDNPVAGIALYRSVPRQRVLTIGELHRFDAALAVEPEPWKSFFALAKLTGARRGALARMRWEDLDLDAATWRIPAVWSKNHKVITVALAGDAVDILQLLRKERGTLPWVFASRSKVGHLTEPKRAWRRICARAGIQGAVIHDLRRTVGTLVAADGAGAAVIGAVLGHISLQSAKSYIHLSAEMARDAVERVARKTSRAG